MPSSFAKGHLRGGFCLIAWNMQETEGYSEFYVFALFWKHMKREGKKSFHDKHSVEWRLLFAC